jgi:hypothetical protein
VATVSDGVPRASQPDGIGRLVVRKAMIRRLDVGRLHVRHLIVDQLEVRQRTAGSAPAA